MKFSVTIPNLPGQVSVTLEAESQLEVFQQAHFWQSLPTVCPVDDSPTRFSYKEPQDGIRYPGLANTGPGPTLEYKCGTHKTGGTLFAKEEWAYYNADERAEVVLWSNGRLTQAGEAWGKQKAKPQNVPQPIQKNGSQMAQPSTNGSAPQGTAQAKPKLISPGEAVIIHTAGVKFYGVNEWTQKIQDGAEWASNGRVKTIEALTISEGKALLASIEKAIAKRELESQVA